MMIVPTSSWFPRASQSKVACGALETGDFDSNGGVVSWFPAMGWKPGEESQSGRSGRLNRHRFNHHLHGVGGTYGAQILYSGWLTGPRSDHCRQCRKQRQSELINAMLAHHPAASIYHVTFNPSAANRWRLTHSAAALTGSLLYSDSAVEFCGLAMRTHACAPRQETTTLGLGYRHRCG
jgi:hypothetical protein